MEGTGNSETGRIRCRRVTVSDTELCEFFLALTELRGRELIEFLSAYCLCAKANTEFFAELTEFAPKLSEAQ